jgi:DNA replication protein DnaC
MRQKKTKPQALTEELLTRMNIGRRYWKAEMADLPETTAKGLFRRYMTDLDSQYEGGWGLFIYGPNGVGKTHASCAMLKEISKRGYSTYCTLADELKVAFIDGSRFDADNSIIDRVRKVDFLLIEDLGKEYSGNGSGFAELCFENLLRKRCRELLPTIITTNLSRKAFFERYKQSAASLAQECMVAVEMSGEDRRAAIGRDKVQGL